MTGEPKVRDECGVIGIHSPNAAELAVLGLHALQHRGQESAGVASFDHKIHLHKAMGLVDAVFSGTPYLPGTWAIGHNRYSTSGGSTSINAGPFIQMTDLGPLVVAHNGNIINARVLTSWLRDEYGVMAESSSDSEIIALMIRVAPGQSWTERIQWMSRRVRGSYSLVLLTGEKLFGVRDPMGNRPLALGRLRDGWALSSESCAFSLLGGTPTRDIRPGEIVEINAVGPVLAGQLEPRSQRLLRVRVHLHRPAGHSFWRAGCARRAASHRRGAGTRTTGGCRSGDRRARFRHQRGARLCD